MTKKNQGFLDKFSFSDEDFAIKSQLIDILGLFKKECRDLGFSFELDEDHFMLFFKTGNKKSKE
jgi:hypothetical protein